VSLATFATTKALVAWVKRIQSAIAVLDTTEASVSTRVLGTRLAGATATALLRSGHPEMLYPDTVNAFPAMRRDIGLVPRVARAPLPTTTASTATFLALSFLGRYAMDLGTAQMVFVFAIVEILKR